MREAVVLELHGRFVLGRGVRFEVDDVGVLLQKGIDPTEVSFSAQPSMTTSVPSAASCAVAFTRTPCKLLLQRGGMRREQLLRNRHAREFSVEGVRSFLPASAMRRSASRISIDGVFISCASSVTSSPGLATTTKYTMDSVRLIRNRIALRPLGQLLVEGVALGEEIAQDNAPVGERVAKRRLRARILPRDAVPRPLFPDGRFRRGAPSPAAMRRGVVFDRPRRRRRTGGAPALKAPVFRADGSFQELAALVMSFDIEQQLAVLLGGFPTRSGDVHQAEAAQLLDKILTLRRKEHKVVFCHFSYHNIAPSPAACCLVFTIF